MPTPPVTDDRRLVDLDATGKLAAGSCGSCGSGTLGDRFLPRQPQGIDRVRPERQPEEPVFQRDVEMTQHQAALLSVPAGIRFLNERNWEQAATEFSRTDLPALDSGAVYMSLLGAMSADAPQQLVDALLSQLDRSRYFTREEVAASPELSRNIVFAVGYYFPQIFSERAKTVESLDQLLVDAITNPDRHAKLVTFLNEMTHEYLMQPRTTIAQHGSAQAFQRMLENKSAALESPFGGYIPSSTVNPSGHMNYSPYSVAEILVTSKEVVDRDEKIDLWLRNEGNPFKTDHYGFSSLLDKYVGAESNEVGEAKALGLMISRARELCGQDDIWKDDDRFFRIPAQEQQDDAIAKISEAGNKIDSFRNNETLASEAIALAKRSPLAAGLIERHLAFGTTHLLRRIIDAFK